ncbi:MAG: T9SS type A sorting domain-containing protein [Niastella sp.]|nr:T9SS type A sorting domain-containing protein [Niastella sp.]
MPIRIFVFYCLVLLLPAHVWCQAPPVGQWRDHLPYHQSIQVAASADKIWCATPWSLFSIDVSDNSIERFSKINGLSETGITAIGLQPAGNKLAVAYYNSRVDVLEGNDIYTIDAIRTSPVTGDKSIHHILMRGQEAFLSTGIGIIVINLDKYEVKDTYIIGGTGNKVPVQAVAADGQFFYAATTEGLKRAPVSGSNLADFRSWQNLSGSNGLTTGEVSSIAVWDNKLAVLKNDSVFVSNNSTWQFLYANEWRIQHLDVSGNKLLLSEELNTAGRVTVLTTQGTVDERIEHISFTRRPRQAIFAADHYWIADTLSGLSQYASGRFEPFVPNSPYSIATGPLQVFNHTLWAAAGGVTANWQPTNNKDGLYAFSNDSWTNFNANSLAALDSFPDVASLAVDPLDESVWAGSFGGGLLHIKTDRTLELFKQNSPLQQAYFSPGSYRVSGLAFDAENNLWIANYGGLQNIAVRKKDGNWRSFFVPYSVPENGVGTIIIDDVNQKWIIGPNGNGLFCFNHGQSIDNPGDDLWKWYRAGKGNGNLPDNNVLSIAKDKSGFIWVGTRQGIGIVQCPQEAFSSSGCEAILPVVQQDNFAGYLFSDEQVQCIAVDGADRKWIGTKNGVWLISADGAKTLYRFTAANSPLVSDDVQQIAIDGNSGEVFFATSKGMCSFRSTATEATSSNSNVLVFPNPVPPGYTGTIAIRGVANNSIVKIAEMDGRLVFQTRALGGQAVWNGKDYKGRTISTGIYLVLVSDDNKQEKTVGKIVFIKK